MTTCDSCGETADFGVCLVREDSIEKHYGEYCTDCTAEIDLSIEKTRFKLRNPDTTTPHKSEESPRGQLWYACDNRKCGFGQFLYDYEGKEGDNCPDNRCDGVIVLTRLIVEHDLQRSPREIAESEKGGDE